VPFRDRVEAGRLLAERLVHLQEQDVVVLGLPRGGVPVAAEVAHALGVPLDVILVRKLGVPFQPELAMGAIGEEGVRVVNRDIVAAASVGEEALRAVEQRESVELERRARLYRGTRSPTPLSGRTALIVDDGIATGSTARAACRVARARGAARVVLAAPVVAPTTIATLEEDADEVVWVAAPTRFYAIGQWYDDFSPTPDEEVTRLLAAAASGSGTRPAGDPIVEDVVIGCGTNLLPGRLEIPPDAVGMVLFAHGSGSSRHSPRNRLVADALHRVGLGTLLFDLLTEDEEPDRTRVFDIPLLAERLACATGWWQDRGDPLPVGYFGSSTGAAAALWAAAGKADVGAVVSRGGRPDLAAPRLGAVRAPTLLIVGERDETVLDLNRSAQAAMGCETRLEVIPGATHLFTEPGTLERAARLAGSWFVDHLAPPG
jgi:putative phosphoribosyl transferase